jgi:hypothetical protein
MKIKLENGNKILEIDEVDENGLISFFYDTQQTGDIIKRMFFLTNQEAMKVIDFLINQTNEPKQNERYNKRINTRN